MKNLILFMWACPLMQNAGNNMESILLKGSGFRHSLFFAPNSMEAKKELKQWLNPSRVHGITQFMKKAMLVVVFTS